MDMKEELIEKVKNKRLYSQAESTVWAGLFPPYWRCLPLEYIQYSCGKAPCLAKKFLAHPALPLVNTASKTLTMGVLGLGYMDLLLYARTFSLPMHHLGESEQRTVIDAVLEAC